MWVFMFEIETNQSVDFDFDDYDFIDDDLDDCFDENEEYVFDEENDCYCWYDPEYDVWYWLDEEAKEWILVEEEEETEEA